MKSVHKPDSNKHRSSVPDILVPLVRENRVFRVRAIGVLSKAEDNSNLDSRRLASQSQNELSSPGTLTVIIPSAAYVA